MSFPATINLTQIHRNYKQLGATKIMEDVALRTLNRVFLCRILKGLKIEKLRPEFLTCQQNYRGQFLNENLLMEFADRPEYELSKRFVKQALGKGDECYGFLDGNVLAAYGWYSNTPTEISPPGLVVHFDDRYSYMYKGFTHLKYRGQRLYPTGMTRVLEAYLTRGKKGIVCYVESNNFDSLKSCYRMGYTDFGKIYLIRLFNHYWLHSDAGCQRNGFGLETRQSPREPETAPRADRAVG